MSDDTPQNNPTAEPEVELAAAAAAAGAYASAAAASESSTSPTPALEAELARLQDELTTAKEQGLRALAEAQNIRRRAEADIEKAHKFGLEKFANELLPVADNLERALDAANNTSDIKALVEGVEMTLKALLAAFEKQQLIPVSPEGEPFNPQLHQAMTAVENPNVEANTVLNVFQKGYTLHGRLVRPAMVVVSKAP